MDSVTRITKRPSKDQLEDEMALREFQRDRILEKLATASAALLAVNKLLEAIADDDALSASSIVTLVRGDLNRFQKEVREHV